MECVSVVDAESAGYASGIAHAFIFCAVLALGIRLSHYWWFRVRLWFRPSRTSSLTPMSGMSYFDQYRK